MGKSELEKLYELLKEKYGSDEAVRDAVNVGGGAAAIALLFGMADAVSPKSRQTVPGAVLSSLMAAAMVGGGIYGANKLKEGKQALPDAPGTPELKAEEPLQETSPDEETTSVESEGERAAHDGSSSE